MGDCGGTVPGAEGRTIGDAGGHDADSPQTILSIRFSDMPIACQSDSALSELVLAEQGSNTPTSPLLTRPPSLHLDSAEVRSSGEEIETRSQDQGYGHDNTPCSSRRRPPHGTAPPRREGRRVRPV